MRNLHAGVMLFAFVAVCGSASAQQKPKAATRSPIPITSGYFDFLDTHPKHEHSSKLSAFTHKAIQAQDPRIVSIPTFTSSFTFGGQVFPFNIAGHRPPKGTSNISTSYIPLSFFFDECVDQNKNNVVIDTTTITDEIKGSPGLSAGVCDNILEVGDVIVNLSPEYTEVTLDGFTHHPQNLALLQWFEGKSPSNAINGDYSFPNATLLTSPFTACPTGP